MITATMPASAQRSDLGVFWEAVTNRDVARDGEFVYAVRTTGIFCRPSCGSRRPNRENVEFYRKIADAQLAGYRPCKRCRPGLGQDLGSDPIAIARSLIQRDPAAAGLAGLAKQVGLSPSYLQRRFKDRYGLSPREMAARSRAERLREALRTKGSVARATYDAGYGSSRGVYDAAKTSLGMTPADYANGGIGQTIRFTTTKSPFGPLLVAVTDRGVCAVLLGKTESGLERELTKEFPSATLERVDDGTDTFLRQVIDQATTGVRGAAAKGPIPLDLRGTAFQVRVWKALLSIPRGASRSYSDIARKIGRPQAVRAVASAIGSNRLAIVVPCHRVVRQDGSLGGYRWGLPVKRLLIASEQAPGTGAASR